MANILIEELSISNGVVEKANEIATDLARQFEWVPYVPTYPNMIFTQNRVLEYKKKDLRLQLTEPLWGVIEHVICQVAWISQERDGEFINDWGGFVQDSKAVYITLVSTKEELDIEKLRTTLYHEFEHVYQCSLQRERFKIDDSYLIASRHANLNDSSSLGVVSCLLYWLNKKEIDANMHGIYGELKHKAYSESTEAYALWELLRNLVSSYKALDKDGEEFDAACQTLHLSQAMKKKLDWYIGCQYKYFLYKFGKVLQRIRNERIHESLMSPRDRWRNQLLK